jgi:acyl dehydratase
MKKEAGKIESGLDSEMSEKEWHKAVDEHIKQRNKNKGEVTVSQMGMYPPNEYYSYYFGRQNKLASEDLIRHYADALGDTNPLWRSRDYAEKTIYGGIIAPPTFEVCIAPTYTMFKQPNLPGWAGLVGGSNREYFKVIYAGDEIRVFDKFLGIEEKSEKGKPYRLFVDTTRREYVNQRNEVVVHCDSRFIIPAFFPGKLKDAGKSAYGDVITHKITKEELDGIHRAYEDEEINRRGAKVRYWQDVVVGEELPPIAMGPLDPYDTCSFFAAIGYSVAFGVKYRIFKADPTYGRLDEETGEYRSTAESHLTDYVAKLNRNAPRAYGFGAQSEGMIAHLITNWMGDDGFVKKMDLKVRRLNLLGQASYIKGKVVKKYVEDGQHLVGLECWVEYLDGKRTCEGTAAVRLNSHGE